MSRKVRIARTSDYFICISIETGKRASRVFLTEDQAQHLSNRLQSFAKGNYGNEIAVDDAA